MTRTRFPKALNRVVDVLTCVLNACNFVVRC